jgi:hypothetical protein
MAEQSRVGPCIRGELVPIAVFVSLIDFSQSVGGRPSEGTKLGDDPLIARAAMCLPLQPMQFWGSHAIKQFTVFGQLVPLTKSIGG